MSDDVLAATEWLERTQANARRFARLLESDVADLREQANVLDTYEARRRLERIQAILDRIVRQLPATAGGSQHEQETHPK